MKTSHAAASAAALATLLLGGCANSPPDGAAAGMSSVAPERASQTAPRPKNSGEGQAAPIAVQPMPIQPLSADAAVQLALRSHRELPVAHVEAERTPASPAAVAAQTRKAWVEAVAARQGVISARQVDDAAQAGAELAARMAKAGNFSQLDKAREQAFQAEATAGVMRARQQADASREALTRLLGLQGDDAAVQLPERLPDLPSAALELPESAAIDAHGDVRESYRHYRAAYDLARHYRDQIVPLREQIAHETLLRYNGMLASVFDLLAATREQSAAMSGAIDALKDFWLAEAGLQAALGRPLANAATAPAPHPSSQQGARP